MSSRSLLGSALAFGLALAAGATSVPASLAAQNEPERVVQVVIDKMAFAQSSTTLRVGDTIEWINKDVVDHTATSKAGGWDVVVPAGKTGRLKAARAGAFEYLCRYHPNMTAKLVVEK